MQSAQQYNQSWEFDIGLLMGPHDNTPWSFLGIMQLACLLNQKNRQIDALQLRGLNTGRALTNRDWEHIQGWKWFAVAIGKSNMPRLSVLVNVELCNGVGVFGLLNKIDQAARSKVQTTRNYEEADFQRTFLLWKLGGQSAANIAHHTLGCPSIDSAQSAHINPAISYITKACQRQLEITINLKNLLPKINRPTRQKLLA